MGLLDDIREQNEQPVIRGTPCSVWQALCSLSDEDADGLRRALADPSVRHAVIEEVVNARPIPAHVGVHAIKRHREGLCACSRLGRT